MIIVSQSAISDLVTGKTWASLTADDQHRFMAGNIQRMAIGTAHILTQPCERVKWKGLVAAGLIYLDEHDEFLMYLTEEGHILFCLLMEQYLPVEEQQCA